MQGRRDERRRERETTSTAAACSLYTPTLADKVESSQRVPQITLEVIISPMLSSPILGVGITMVHRKMEHGSQVSEGEDRYGKDFSRPWASARPPNGMGLHYKGWANKHSHV